MYAILAPAGTPREIVSQLNAAFVKTLASPEAVKRLAAVGTEAKSSTPEQAAAYVREQVAKWAKGVAAAGIRVDAK